MRFKLVVIALYAFIALALVIGLRQTVADAGNAERCGRVVAPLRAANDAVARANGEEQLSE